MIKFTAIAIVLVYLLGVIVVTAILSCDIDDHVDAVRATCRKHDVSEAYAPLIVVGYTAILALAWPVLLPRHMRKP